MSLVRNFTPADQLDFWPELRSVPMVGCALLNAPSARPAPARSGSEDGRRASPKASPLGPTRARRVVLTRGAEQ
jgi:hypothetical protein